VSNNLTLSANARSRLFYGYYVVLFAFIIMLLAYGVRTSFGVFFKPMQEEFSWTRAFTSGAVTVSMLVQGVWGIFMGRVNDRVGARLVITLCGLLLGAGLLLTAMTHYSWELYVFYGLIIGLGMGGVFVALMSTVTRWFYKNRGLMTGIVLAGIGFGTVMMAPVSNWLISLYGWRRTNVILGLAVLVVVVCAAQFLKRDPSKIGTAAYGETGGQREAVGADKVGLSLRQAAATRQFWTVIGVFASLGYTLFTITIHLVPHMTDLGISSATAANVLAVTGAIQSVGGVIFGSFADRIGNRNVLLIGLVVSMATLFWLGWIAAAALFYLFAVINSFGQGAGAAMESTITAELFGMKSHGLILGMMSFGFTVGGALGPLVTGYLYDLRGDYQLAFIISAIIGLLGVLLTLSIRPIRTAGRIWAKGV
jgi:MFS family permease